MEPNAPEAPAAVAESPAPPDPGKIVERLVEQIHRKALKKVPTDYITRSWLDKMRDVMEAELQEALKAATDIPPKSKPVVASIVRDAWQRTEKQLRPKAWVEKFYAAKTDKDRRAIHFRALKSLCIDLLRRRKWERRHFVSLEALAEQEDGDEDRAWRPRNPYPSYQENYDHPFLKEQFRKALLELPILLVVIVYMLPGTRGKASRLARYMRIPQRQMARHVARIRKHFANHGLRA